MTDVHTVRRCSPIFGSAIYRPSGDRRFLHEGLKSPMDGAIEEEEHLEGVQDIGHRQCGAVRRQGKGMMRCSEHTV